MLTQVILMSAAFHAVNLAALLVLTMATYWLRRSEIRVAAASRSQASRSRTDSSR